ncbi:MAG: type II secretion system F family protein [Bacillota bacterium]|nr:type II secretion system F family protein [Bacillota bacterium]
MLLAALLLAGGAFLLTGRILLLLKDISWPYADLAALAVLLALGGYSWIALLGVGVVWSASLYVRSAREQAKQRAALRAAPGLLDLAAALMGSGSSMQEGLVFAAAEEKDPLSQAIQRAHGRSRMGEPFLQALQKASEGEGIWVGQFLARTLHIHESLGVPLTRTIHEEAQRHRELIRLEFLRQMESLPMKLTLITLFFFLPPLLAVILVPQLLQFLSLW